MLHSQIPLLVILGIFFARHALRARNAMQPPLAQTWYYRLAVRLLPVG